MRLFSLASVLAALWFGSSCLPASGSPSAEAPAKPGKAERAEADESESTSTEKAASTHGLPTECKEEGKYCFPPGDFVERVCMDKFPGLAIVWFAKGTPWTRRYVRLPEVEPRNTTGGATSDAKLVMGEEVLVLKRHGGGGGVQVSGAVDYDVLRWDGTCASMSELEFAVKPPGTVKNAPIVWKYLDSPVQEALLKDAAIEKAQQAQRKACGGNAAGGGKACEQANRKLNSAIVSAVRGGLELPTPGLAP
jgi:hypothetical protein